MANYKITNLTNTAGKRDLKFNTTLSIDYVDSMQRKSIQVKPGETIFLQIHSLPLSVHKLRVKKLISVIEVSTNELNNSMNAGKPVVTTAPVEEPKNIDMRVDTTPRKKIGKKLHDTEVPGNE
jgi:hypothetical protein